MKQVTFTGVSEGAARVASKVKVGKHVLRLGEPLVVSEAEAKLIDSTEGYEFSTEDAPKGTKVGDTPDDDDKTKDED